jgi:hypothetical protein
MENTTTPPPKDLIGFLDFYLVQKAPFQLPPKVKEAIVKFGPWIGLVLIILSLPFLLLALGLGAFLLPLAGASAHGIGIAWIVLLVQVGLTIAALPGLFARKMSGWRLAFYSRLVAILTSLLLGNVVGAIVVGLISLYVLFQIRTLYTV